MSEHTPGPWTALNDSLVRGPHGQAVAATRVSTIQPFDPNHAANARLIAAAPELLEALHRILASAGFSSGQAQPTLKELTVSLGALHEARAAIAKASPESEV